MRSMAAPDRVPVSRERILEAAARVYALHGFRGATTRLIANEAGVNEVTLFRTFGSKSALIEAVLAQHKHSRPVVALPVEPVDPALSIDADPPLPSVASGRRALRGDLDSIVL